MQKELPTRERLRLKGYDYSSNGAYFITICVENRHEMLGEIVVGYGILDAQCIRLSEYGTSVIETIEFLNKINNNIIIDKYVIMPNHVHLIVIVNNMNNGTIVNDTNNGASGKPRPTNAIIPKVISSIKRFTNKQAGVDMWQTSYHDRVIRNEDEYQKIWQYIDDNPINWVNDEYYKKQSN